MVAFMVVAVPPSVEFAHATVLEYEIENARPVIEALRAFQATHQRPARVLSQLTPGFLMKPAQPVSGACHYRYEVFSVNVAGEPHGHDQGTGNPASDQQTWDFSIECPADWLFDVEVLVYRPDGEYERIDHSNQRPIGDWMYYYFRD